MVGKIKDKKGATLIEAVMIILVLAIIGATVVGVIVFFAQLFMYSPRQLDAQKIGQELSNIMFEGDRDRNLGINIRGIRYTRVVIDASSTQLSYTYGYETVPATSTSDTLSIRYRWNSADKHIYRSTSTNGGANWSIEEVLPYYISSGLKIDDLNRSGAGAIFSYKKAGDSDWVSGTDPLTAIRRVVLGINLQTGTGTCQAGFGNFQGCTNITSSAEIKAFQ